MKKVVNCVGLLLLGCFFAGCRNNEVQKKASFEVLDHQRTGLNFSNRLTPTSTFNMFKYMYFYNGAGVGAGDFNNDGWIDLFFSSNQEANKLYLNQKNLQFKDVTGQAAIPQDSGWNTGVSVVDINSDGLLDIYVCRVSGFEGLKGTNQLLVCQGIGKDGVPVYKEEAAKYGIAFSGFSTQAAFFDYDLDGDLDMYLLNHSVHQNGTFAERKNFLGTYHPTTGDRIYQNDGGQFNDVTKGTGINSSAIGYGLGIAVSDINLDGYPDVYVGNDFHENDYLYLNQQNGTFKEVLTERMPHTSQFSMGVDVADINNDALPEIISMDMLPSDPYVLKRSLGEDEYNIFYMKLGYGYHPQFAKNSLQLNRGGGKFTDIAMYAGVFATDWSWAPLWMDFDNDGRKDLFVSNGIPKRLNDIDYVNYVSNSDVQQKMKTNSMGEKEMAVVNNFPEIKLPNRFFHNKGAAQFEEMTVKGDRPTFSNGSVYADFDNDGDLDVVVNNINDPVLLYQNKRNEEAGNKYLSLKLQGSDLNPLATGARLIVFSSNEKRTYEQYPVKGFQSSMQAPLLVGLSGTQVDSMLLVWPDNSYQRIGWNGRDSSLNLHYQSGLPSFDYNRLALPTPPVIVEDETAAVGFQFLHEENPFVEFDREPLVPFMLSREGPALAVADINGDGMEDVFIGSSKGHKGAVMLQQRNGRFVRLPQPALDADSTWEDVDAAWVDVNNDKHVDLVVASGGNEYYGSDEHLLPRVYLNDGQLHFAKVKDAFTGFTSTASCVAAEDVNGDGFVDLFIGGRAVPFAYGEVPRSYLLINDQHGKFKEATPEDLKLAGFVKHAVWADMDGDRDRDLVLSLEWGGIVAFVNNKGVLTKKVLTEKKGWWNFTLPVDVDGDGDLDLVAGNVGMNNRFATSTGKPVRMYFDDFDGNGQKEQVVTYYLGGKEIVFANKGELEKQMPSLKKRFLYAEDFAKSTFDEMFPPGKREKAKQYSADYFEHALLINDGKMNFTLQALPWQAQIGCYKDAIATDANKDGKIDVLLVGNFYDNNIQAGWYDGDRGALMLNEGGGKFVMQQLTLEGQIRHIRKIKTPLGESFLLARNNDSAKLVQLR
jgi:enediyne biosynthesis protein E4